MQVQGRTGRSVGITWGTTEAGMDKRRVHTWKGPCVHLQGGLSPHAPAAVCAPRTTVHACVGTTSPAWPYDNAPTQRQQCQGATIHPGQPTGMLAHHLARSVPQPLRSTGFSRTDSTASRLYTRTRRRQAGTKAEERVYGGRR